MTGQLSDPPARPGILRTLWLISFIVTAIVGVVSGVATGAVWYLEHRLQLREAGTFAPVVMFVDDLFRLPPPPVAETPKPETPDPDPPTDVEQPSTAVVVDTPVVAEPEAPVTVNAPAAEVTAPAAEVTTPAPEPVVEPKPAAVATGIINTFDGDKERLCDVDVLVSTRAGQVTLKTYDRKAGAEPIHGLDFTLSRQLVELWPGCSASASTNGGVVALRYTYSGGTT